jgi:hypothetical protein
MKNGLLKLLPLSLLVAVGCNSGQTTQAASADQSGSSKTPSASSDSKSSVSGTPVPDSSTPATTGDKSAAASPPPASTPPAALPASLHHEGFDYSGVTHTAPIDLEMTSTANPGAVTTGSQTITFDGIKDGKAIYKVDRTGGLAAIGTEEWTISKDGVFMSKSSIVDAGGMAMELPAHPKPGMTWKFHAKASSAGINMDMVMTLTILRKEKVTTKAGTFEDALVVEQDGVGTMQTQKTRTVSQNWYVKGLGLVKAEMKTVGPDGKTQSVSIQETNAK